MPDKASPANSEWLTRKKLVDPKLRDAGWKILPAKDFSPSRPLSDFNGCAIEEFPTQNGPADYALCSGGRIVGIVEAKKLTLGPQNVLTQAERYSLGVTASPFNFRDFRVPFIYSTSGEVIWHRDLREEKNRSHQISGFHSSSALEERLASDFASYCKKLIATPNDHDRLRPYQKEANQAAEEAIAARKRHMLLAMATGTGKTFTMVNQVYRLMKSGVAKRVLFLVDRKALAAQAVQAFASFEPEPGLKFNKIYEVYSQRFQKEDFEEEKFDPKILPAKYLTDPKPGLAFVYVSTIQRMTINLFGREAAFDLGDDSIEDDADRLSIPIHAFDVIIADECHRGYTSQQLNVWRSTLEHFDAIKIGLTATPASHTMSYFKEKVFEYRYEQAVREGFLVDYDVVTVKSNVRMNGVFLKEDETVEIVDTQKGTKQLDLLEDERKFDPSEVETKVTSPDSNKKIMEELRKYADEHQERYGRFPKTLIFAHNDLPHTSHADQLVETARDVFGRGDDFVKKITGKVDRPLQAIREFRNRDKTGIVVTVDLLSTGVDIPDLEFIVFLRPVQSRILFEQMLGRGTRKSPTHPDKSHFTVFDCFDGTLLESFSKATSMTVEKLLPPPRTIIEIIEDIWQNRDRDYNTRCLVKRFRRIDKEMSAEARTAFAAFIPNGDVGAFGEELPARLKNDFTGTMQILRNPDFQNLLINYPRAQRTFVVAIENEDEVTSEWKVKGNDGKEYKPDDYLAEFSRFIAEKADEVQAIGILLDHPKDWNPEALKDLREKLASAPQRFTVEHLQKAHQIKHHKALADIISMVKHAASEDESLYTADERVNRAFMRLTGSVKYTSEQEQWLDRIRSAMVENLSLDRDDFDTLPVLVNGGGWGKAKRVFGEKLSELINKLNEAVAA
jgi:type I restriction enzyme R subunit